VICPPRSTESSFRAPLTPMQKPALVASLVSDLRARYDRALAALAGAHEAATGADTKAEHKYDTRGLEASYLAAGQAEQVEELRRALRAVESCPFRECDPDEPIAIGALVETEQDGELRTYLLAPAGGGIVLESEEGESVIVLGPASPLAGRLMGARAGEILDDPEILVLEIR
jgi:hypothetical protein